MELVYKKDGFITKLFACLFLAIFIIMCLVGNFVFAGSFEYDNITFSYGDSFIENSPYYAIFATDDLYQGTHYFWLVRSNSPIKLRVFSSSATRLIAFNTNENGISSYLAQGQGFINYFNDTTFSVPTDNSRYVSASGIDSNWSCILTNYDLVNIDDENDILFSKSVERGTGSSSDSGETGNETTGGDTNTSTDSDDSGGFFSSVKEGISNIIQFFKDIIGFIGNILSYLNPLDDNFILKGVIEFLGNILDYLNPFSDNFILKRVLEFLGNVLSYINPFSENFFGYKIIDLLKSALQWLFIPSDERISALHNTVTSKFDFVTTIKTASDNMKNLIENTGNAPKLKIRTFKTKYTNEQEQVILDFSWYAPFKAYGDAIITGFVYALFFWRLFISVPNIIKGNAGVISDVDSIKISNSGKGLKL